MPGIPSVVPGQIFHLIPPLAEALGLKAVVNVHGLVVCCLIIIAWEGGRLAPIGGTLDCFNFCLGGLGITRVLACDPASPYSLTPLATFRLSAMN